LSSVFVGTLADGAKPADDLGPGDFVIHDDREMGREGVMIDA
jgi:hypothetical protein